MTGRTFNTDPTERLSDSRVREKIVSTLKNLLASKSERASREECCEEAADLIVAVLKAEFSRPERQAAIEGADGDDREITPVDFRQITRKALGEVRFGYLSSNLQMMEALGSAISERDTGDSGHAYRVVLYATKLAEAVALEKPEIQSLIKGSFLHDVGKIGIGDQILLKQGKLTNEEKTTMQNHVLKGARILKDVRWLEDAQDVVLFHHERWDGTGYLAGLEGDAIPTNARIFALVDVFDALSSDRPYKPRMTYADCVKHMQDQRGYHFEPALLDSFIDISENLSNEVASVALPDLPSLLIHTIDKYFEIDLTEDRLRTRYSDL